MEIWFRRILKSHINCHHISELVSVLLDRRSSISSSLGIIDNISYILIIFYIKQTIWPEYWNWWLYIQYISRCKCIFAIIICLITENSGKYTGISSGYIWFSAFIKYMIMPEMLSQLVLQHHLQTFLSSSCISNHLFRQCIHVSSFLLIKTILKFQIYFQCFDDIVIFADLADLFNDSAGLEFRRRKFNISFRSEGDLKEKLEGLEGLAEELSDCLNADDWSPALDWAW